MYHAEILDHHLIQFISVSSITTMQSPTEKKQGVYTYLSQWPIYSLAWSVRGDKNARLAIGSFLEDYSNKVELVQFSHDTFDFSTDNRLVFDHPYSPTNLMFFPSEDTTNPDIIATSGDYLRLWEIHEDRIELKALLNGNKTSEFNSAITSFDWAECDTRHIATSSVDTTCTIWDVETEIVDSQLVAHDKEVYDISWGGFNVFASVSGDGSVRVFDLRDKERSTIIYENPVRDSPLLAGLAFMFSSSILLQILACAIYSNWWPMLSALMYVLVPMPCLFFGGGSTQFLTSRDGGGWIDAAKFMTGASAVGSIAIPIILRHAHMIETGAMLIEFTSFFIFACTVMCFHRASLEEDW
nr:wd repeat-containing protein lwd1 [Quercus suber]